MTESFDRQTRVAKDVVHEEITRLWGDTPVVDADQNLRVIIQPCDVENAAIKDPGSCVFAQACKRSFGAKKVLFFRSVAYVELPMEDGKRRVERFELTSQMRELIETFDKGSTVIPEAGFVMKAPRKSMRLDGKHRQNKKDTERRRKSRLEGTKTVGSSGNKGKGKFSKPPISIDLEVRSGTGQVKFTKREAK